MYELHVPRNYTVNLLNIEHKIIKIYIYMTCYKKVLVCTKKQSLASTVHVVLCFTTCSDTFYVLLFGVYVCATVLHTHGYPGTGTFLLLLLN